MSKHRDVFLERILAVPHLAQVVPQLQPEVLHRIVQRYGLEDCGPLVALATPGQLARVFDLDLWRPAAPGLDEQFDADRFGSWLEVMVDAGVESAAATLAAMDVDLIAGGLRQHVRVLDGGAVAPYVTLDGDLTSGLTFDDRDRCEIGGYVLSATRTGFWTAITTVLSALADAHGREFDRIMAACRRLSNSRPEIDVHDLPVASAQAMFDLAVEREARRDAQGYVAPGQARAFLEASRRIDLRHGAAPLRDPLTRAYFSGIEPVAPAEDVRPEAVAAIVDLLHEAGVMPHTPRARLEGAQSDAPPRARIRALLEFVHDHDPDAYETRNAELAYLANVIAAGSTIQSRSIAEDEASNAAIAVCSLGLENWPAHWSPGKELPDDWLVHHDLVSVFQVGWTVLHEDVCMYTAGQLIALLPSVRSADADVLSALESLRVSLTKHWRAGSPWHSRDALEVIAILDTPAWAALLGLIDQLPTMHAALAASLGGATRQIDASAFEFISENAQIRKVQDFMRLLPQLVRS
jgi:hypothetical protein